MKKIMRIFMALLLLFTITTPALVQANTTGTITITNNPVTTGVSMKGHTYSAYKVFSVIIDENKHAYAYKVADKFKEFFKEAAKNDNVNVDTDAKLDKFAVDYVKNNMNKLSVELMVYIGKNNILAEETTKPEDVVETTEKNEEVTIGGLGLGYYIVIDNGAEGATDGQSVIAATALGTTDTDLKINLKASAPTIDKEIKHNDGDWGNVGDNQIGDVVEYRLTAKLPSNLTGYETYKYVIHDTLTKGLTFNNDIKIEVGNTVISSDYYSVTYPATDSHTFDVSIDIIKAINAKVLKEGETLYIYYSATLNEDAVVAGDSNDNTVNLEYSNNPYNDKETTTTPEVTVKDYTFKVNGLKVNENQEALKDVEFKLSIGENDIKFKKTDKEDGTNVYVVCTEKEHTNICGTEIVSGSNGKFEIIGLDDGVEYTLTETKPLPGYNAIDPIKFTITAVYDENGEITGISTDGNIGAIDGTFELGTTIVNTKGDKLPETGGVGTKVFTVVGGLLMVSAAGLLVMKSRR